MKPIYFPYTFVSDTVAQALGACFGPSVVYQPMADNIPEQMQRWIAAGILKIRIPVVEDEKELKTATKNYLDWVNLHTGGADNGAASLKTLKSSLPLVDQLLSSHVAGEVKTRINGDVNAKSPDLLLAARVFLYFAQKFDWQSREVDHDLQWYRQKEEELIRELKMEDDILAGEFQKKQMPMPNTSADYLIADRLEAWTRLFLRDMETSGLFVTHNQAVLDHLLDRSPGAEEVLQLESIPLEAEMINGNDSWRCRLIADLVEIVENKQALPVGGRVEAPAFPAAEKTVQLSVYLMPDQSPPEFFSRCAEIRPRDRERADRPVKFRNTLIGLIESKNG